VLSRQFRNDHARAGRSPVSGSTLPSPGGNSKAGVAALQPPVQLPAIASARSWARANSYTPGAGRLKRSLPAPAGVAGCPRRNLVAGGVGIAYGCGMSIDMFVDPDADPRTDPPTRADERATLAGFLRWQRDTLELKCSGLDAADLARRSVDPSTLSLLGLVRHMAEVERGWFRRVLAGQDAPPYFSSDADPDGDFDGATRDPKLVAQAWEVWRAEVAFAERLVADAPDLEVTGHHRHRGPVSLRWVLVHMIEEYARHLGHADLLRQRIDGRVGQ
jgi:uncharacterized damage-inducible protein DinB